MYKCYEKNGQIFKRKILGEEHIQSSYELLNNVAKEMVLEGHEDYVIPKTLEQVATNIRNNKVAGIFSIDVATGEEKLVAEMSYVNIPEKEKDIFLPSFKAKNLSVKDMDYIGSVCTLKEYRGMGFAKKLNELLEKKSNKQYSITTVALTNYKSFGCFLGQGFILTQGTEIDPVDGAKIMYLIKDKKDNFNFKCPSEEEIRSNGMIVKVEDKNYEKFMKEINDNKQLVGYKFHKNSKSILFVPENGLFQDLGINNQMPILGGSQQHEKEGEIYVQFNN